MANSISVAVADSDTMRFGAAVALDPPAPVVVVVFAVLESESLPHAASSRLAVAAGSTSLSISPVRRPSSSSARSADSVRSKERRTCSVAAASRRLVIVIDPSKRVGRLGTRYPVPVEVTEFGWSTHLTPLRALGAEPALRVQLGTPVRTDGGNVIIDARFPNGIDDPATVAAELRARPGVIETGRFLGFDPEVIVGADA